MSDNIVALDIGKRRIGVARANTIARIPEPLTTLLNDESFENRLGDIINEQAADVLVVGLPRNMSGDDTDQTTYVRSFVSNLKTAMQKKVVFQDEAVTSIKAEEFLRSRGKAYTKEDIDAVAAMYILEDYLRDNA